MEQSDTLIPIDTTKDQVVEMWISAVRSTHSGRAYRRYVERFRSFINTSVKEVTLVDLHSFAESLHNLPENSQ